MTTLTPTSTAAPNNRRMRPVTAHPSPPKHSDRTGFNEKAAGLIAKFVGSMWMFYASIIGFAIWMAGLGVTVAGDHYPFNLMLLAVGGIMQWLAMRNPRRPERSGRRSGQTGGASSSARRDNPYAR